MDAEAVRLGFQKVGTVSGLYIYPVKSCAWIPLQKAECTRWGLRHQAVTDRHWMVTRADYSFITQRQYSKLALVDVSVTDDDMQLTAPGMPRLRVDKVTKEDPSKVVMVRAQVLPTSPIMEAHTRGNYGRWNAAAAGVDALAFLCSLALVILSRRLFSQKVN